MAIYIYKYLEYVPWDVTGVGVVQHTTGGRVIAIPPAVDLSNYYTKNQLFSYHSSRVHWTNIIWDGRLAAYLCCGEATVTGTLADTSTRLARGTVNGASTVTGEGWTYCEFLKGSSGGSASVSGFAHLNYGGGETYVFQYSIEEDSSNNVNLVGDTASPGNSKLYGTNSSGVRGWYDIPTAGIPDAHATTHQNGGSDEISVAGLSGVLADAQTPAAHDLTSAYHTDSGLTTGHFLKATGATTFAWGAHGLTYTDVGAQQTHANLTSLATLSYTSASFVKMTAANTFSLTNLVEITWGSKYSASHAGSLGETSVDDDYFYVCVVAGGVGSATWKKIALTQSP
jgi:hypothetical protein